MLHVGLDLSRRRLDYLALTEAGERLETGAAPPDADGCEGSPVASPATASRFARRSNR